MTAITQQQLLRDVTEITERRGELFQPSSPWPLCGEATALLERIVERQRPTSVLEFGAGLSSISLACALAKNGGGRLTSVDHAPEYARESWPRAEATRGVEARLIHADIKLRLSAEGLFYTFTGIKRAIASRAPYDLVLVDSPPGKYGRDASLHLAWPHLSHGAIIVLDDYRRWREQCTVRGWMTRYGGLRPLFLDPAFGRGVAVLRRESSKLARSWPLAYARSFYDLYTFGPVRSSDNLEGTGECG